MGRTRPLAFVAVVGLGVVSLGSPPPKPAPSKPEPRSRPTVAVPLEDVGAVDWHVDKNVVHAGRLKATAVDGLKPITWFYEPSRRDGVAPDRDGPPRPPFHVYFSKEGNQVVDERVFTDLEHVSARKAEKMDAVGVVVGRVLSEDYDPSDLAQFLVVTGIVDANLHVIATVRGRVARAKDGSHWFRLSSDDPYWTNQANRAHYDFGIEVAANGTIRVYNVKYDGRRVVKGD